MLELQPGSALQPRWVDSQNGKKASGVVLAIEFSNRYNPFCDHKFFSSGVASTTAIIMSGRHFTTELCPHFLADGLDVLEPGSF